eukprot:2210420-Amphidinium_carterae.1
MDGIASIATSTILGTEKKLLKPGPALQLKPCRSLRHLELDGQSQKDNVKSAFNAALGGVWHEARVQS